MSAAQAKRTTTSRKKRKKEEENLPLKADCVYSDIAALEGIIEAHPEGVSVPEGTVSQSNDGQSKERIDLLIDGKVVKASYNSGVKEHFVHVTEVREQNKERQRFIVGAKATSKGKRGEWGAALSILDGIKGEWNGNQQDLLVSHDAGMTVQLFGAWLDEQKIFYLARVKGNSGHLYDWVCEQAQKVFSSCPEGDFFEAARVSGSEVHSRRLWRIPLAEPAQGIYPGLREVIIVEKGQDHEQKTELQYFLSSYSPSAWIAKEILARILLHWDTETGVFSVKDRVFQEDKARYRHISGANARIRLNNVAFNLLNAPLFQCFWELDAPLSHRIQFLRDHPDYNPLCIPESTKLPIQENEKAEEGFNLDMEQRVEPQGNTQPQQSEFSVTWYRYNHELGCFDPPLRGVDPNPEVSFHEAPYLDQFSDQLCNT